MELINSAQNDILMNHTYYLIKYLSSLYFDFSAIWYILYKIKSLYKTITSAQRKIIIKLNIIILSTI